MSTDLGIGPQSLPQFEDRLLSTLVDLTGGGPVDRHKGVTEYDLAVPLAGELGISPDFVKCDEFYSSEQRGLILSCVRDLEDEGLVDTQRVMGPWRIRPTRDGRQRVAQWRKQWEENHPKLDRLIQQRILEQLEEQRRNDPSHYEYESQVDIDRICTEFGVEPRVYVANAQRLLQQRKIAQGPLAQQTVENGEVYVTEAGIQWLENSRRPQRPDPSEQQLWVRIAELERRLKIAERNPHSLITDDELRSRCLDLIERETHYDRAVREACVVLEDRVRKAIGAGRDAYGTDLMNRAFNADRGPLRLSQQRSEQTGVMHLYAGMMGFFRNSAGHNLVDDYTQDDALRFVAFVDLLLSMVARAGA